MVKRRDLFYGCLVAFAVGEPESCCTVSRESVAWTGESLVSAAPAVAKRAAPGPRRRVRVDGGEFRMGTDRPKILGDGEGPSRLVVGVFLCL